MRMKSSPKLRPNGWDGLAAAVVLVLAVACAALVWTGGGQSGPLTAVVSADGEPVDRVVLADLSGPEERTYTSNGYTLRVAFGPGSAQVTVSDCPTQDCVHTGEITRGGQSIVCLPARIVVQLEGGAAADGQTAQLRRRKENAPPPAKQKKYADAAERPHTLA